MIGCETSLRHALEQTLRIDVFYRFIVPLIFRYIREGHLGIADFHHRKRNMDAFLTVEILHGYGQRRIIPLTIAGEVHNSNHTALGYGVAGGRCITEDHASCILTDAGNGAGHFHVCIGQQAAVVCNCDPAADGVLRRSERERHGPGFFVH